MYAFPWPSHQLLGLWKYYYKRKVAFFGAFLRDTSWLLPLEGQRVSVCVSGAGEEVGAEMISQHRYLWVNH